MHLREVGELLPDAWLARSCGRPSHSVPCMVARVYPACRRELHHRGRCCRREQLSHHTPLNRDWSDRHPQICGFLSRLDGLRHSVRHIAAAMSRLRHVATPRVRRASRRTVRSVATKARMGLELGVSQPRNPIRESNLEVHLIVRINRDLRDGKVKRAKQGLYQRRGAHTRVWKSDLQLF